MALRVYAQAQNHKKGIVFLKKKKKKNTLSNIKNKEQ